MGIIRAMKPAYIIFAVVLMALAGCKSSSRPTDSGPLISSSWSESLMRSEIKLSPKHPVDSDTRIHLVSVGADSTTTIQLDSGAQLSAKPGDYFECEQFGMHGLQLVSA